MKLLDETSEKALEVPSMTQAPHSDSPADIGTISRTAVEVMMQMANISVTDVNIVPSESLDRRVRKRIAEWNFDGIHTSSQQREVQILTVIDLGSMFYSHLGIDIQCFIALYSYLLFLVDDLDVTTQALEEFSMRLCAGIPQLHPILTALNEILARMPDYYLPYPSQSILISTFQFINACAFERTTANMALHQGAVSFPEYKRARSRVSEAYAFFVWDKLRFPDITAYVQVVPDMILLLSYINDLFSFYKEELAGENYNYVHDLVNITGKSTPSVLLDVVQDIATFTGRCRAILEGDTLRVFEEHLQGYVFFHFVTPRYGANRFLDVGKFIDAWES